MTFAGPRGPTEGRTICREKLILWGAASIIVGWAVLAWYGLYRLVAGCP